MSGESMACFLYGMTDAVHGDDYVMGYEYWENYAVRKGDWKLVWLNRTWILPSPYNTDDWELFDLSVDPGETNDLSADYPEKREEMLLEWDAYVLNNGILLPPEP
jgi:arylsulfatase